MKILIEIFSLKKDNRTIGHEVTFVKDQCMLDIRKHSFSQRKINEWNKLSTDCVTVSSVNMFKNKVDTYLRRVDCTKIKNVGLSINQWLPCPLAIWAFGLDGNLVKPCYLLGSWAESPSHSKLTTS